MSIGPYWTGDNPATPITFDLYSEEDFDAYTSATVTIIDPRGEAVATIGAVPIEDDSITFTIPSGSFAIPGLYAFDVLALGEGMVTLPPVPFVVQQGDGWHSLESARREWADAPSDDTQAFSMLESAKTQCIAYAPPFEGRPSVAFRQAQLLQARALWQAIKTDPDGQLDANGFQVQVYPLDRNIRALLRPRQGKPVFL